MKAENDFIFFKDTIDKTFTSLPKYEADKIEYLDERLREITPCLRRKASVATDAYSSIQ